MERRFRLAWLAAPIFSFACSSNNSEPPPILAEPPTCGPPACTVLPPSAAIAFEVGPDVDGGTCSAPVGPISLPEGADAFEAITGCGGNKTRCGSANYRVTGGGGTKLDCSVAGSGTYQVTGHVSSGGVSFDVSGTVGTTSGTVAINAVAEDAGTFSTSCTAKIRVVLKGTIYADFTCPGTDTPGCMPHGTFVFENCGTE